MSIVKKTLAGLLMGGAMLMASIAAQAGEDTRIALVPGGPYPYFAAWEPAGVDAKAEYGLGAADYRVPQERELSLHSQQLESLFSQGYNGFLVFPGGPVGTSSTVSDLAAEGALVIALAGCLQQLWMSGKSRKQM